MDPKPRYRNRRTKPVTATQRRFVNGNETHSMETIMRSSEEEMDDYVVPDFSKRRADGEIINNPCSYLKTTSHSTGNGIFDVLQAGTRYEAYGPGSLTAFMALLLGYPDGYWIQPPDVNKDKLIAAAKHAALGNVDRTPYAFAEDVGEVMETLRFIKRPFYSVYKLSKKIRKHADRRARNRYRRRNRGKDPKGYSPKDYAEAVASIWSEYAFAAAPLVRSMQDLLEASMDDPSRPKRRTARGFSSAAEADSANSGGYYLFDASSFVETEIKAGILYEHSNPVMDWRFKYGLRNKDIPETAWQLLPLSFMVDRVYNISSAIRGLTALLDPNVSMLAAWYSEKTTKVQTRTFQDYSYEVGVESKNIVPDMDIKESFVYQRAVWEPTIGDALPVLTVPNLVNSATKLADLGAVILLNLGKPSLARRLNRR